VGERVSLETAEAAELSEWTLEAAEMCVEDKVIEVVEAEVGGASRMEAGTISRHGRWRLQRSTWKART
jgi:hypothetical protein